MRYNESVKRICLVCFLVFSIVQGLFLGGIGILPQGNSGDLFKVMQALSFGDTISVPQPTERFATEMANDLFSARVVRNLEVNLLLFLSANRISAPINRRQQPFPVNLRPSDWGFTPPLYARGDA